LEEWKLCSLLRKASVLCLGEKDEVGTALFHPDKLPPVRFGPEVAFCNPVEDASLSLDEPSE
jgi:hypothetical protein